MQSRQAERHKKTASLFLRYAAIVIICIAFAGWITYATVNNNMPQPIAQVLSVPAGQRVHITLPDGSKVWVNAGSTLSYPSVFGKERRVKITGEAFFEVAKGKRPFVVSTGKVDVKSTRHPIQRIQLSYREIGCRFIGRLGSNLSSQQRAARGTVTSGTTVNRN